MVYKIIIKLLNEFEELCVTVNLREGMILFCTIEYWGENRRL